MSARREIKIRMAGPDERPCATALLAAVKADAGRHLERIKLEERRWLLMYATPPHLRPPLVRRVRRSQPHA